MFSFSTHQVLAFEEMTIAEILMGKVGTAHLCRFTLSQCSQAVAVGCWILTAELNLHPNPSL